MNESDYMELREIAWRRPLTADEKASVQGYLLVHPDAQHDWEEELMLNQALAALPNAPLSSNFTAQVLQAIDLDDLSQQRKQRTWGKRLSVWWPRFALAGVVLGLGGLGYQQYRLNSLRAKAASLERLVATVASTLPDVKMWQDFDAISKLGQPIAAVGNDEILWAALKSSPEQ